MSQPSAVTASWLAERIEESGISQAHIARTIGIHPSLITRILNGKRRINEHEAVQLLSIFQEPSDRKAMVAAGFREKFVEGKGDTPDFFVVTLTEANGEEFAFAISRDQASLLGERLISKRDHSWATEKVRKEIEAMGGKSPPNRKIPNR